MFLTNIMYWCQGLIFDVRQTRSSTQAWPWASWSTRFQNPRKVSGTATCLAHMSAEYCYCVGPRFTTSIRQQNQCVSLYICGFPSL